MQKPFSLAVVLGLTLAASADPINTAKLDVLFDSLTRHDQAAGSVAIASHGTIVYQRDFGPRQAAGLEYRIGSITKVFTAVMIYQLVDEHRLELDDAIARFFPELPEAEKVTVADLLNHRSGFADFTKGTDFDAWKDHPKTPAELLDLIRQRPRDFTPGARADYNNSNYLLLGYILEKVTGKSYAENLAKRIGAKAGLRHTHSGAGQHGFQPGEAKSYKYFDNAWAEDRAVSLQNFGGAGEILSTPADMLLLMEKLFGGQLISSDQLRYMQTLHDGYGSGLFPYGDAAHPGFGHNGKTEGFGTSVQFYPGSDLAIAYCTNAEVYPKEWILEAIYRICFQLPGDLPTFTPITPPESVLQRYVGSYVSADGNIRMKVTVAGGQLLVATKGQTFPFVALSDTQYWNRRFGFFINFTADGKGLSLRELDAVYKLKSSSPPPGA